MAVYHHKNIEIYYELHGSVENPCIVFLNGLTQRVQHWQSYAEYFKEKGYSVLLFDMMGQGASVKPTLFIEFEDNQRVLNGLLDHIKVEKAYIAGISFGGVVAQRFAIEFPERVKGLIAMSTFSEMDEHLLAHGLNLYEGMVQVGFEYLVKLLVPLNFSAGWIKKHKEALPYALRDSFSYNDLYAIQNMMESLYHFKDFTPDLKKIKTPTLILNGEYDYLTPRTCHEILRKNIKNSKLVLMQHVCHAFTIEIPEITARIIENFLKEVESGKWKGDQSVWIAEDSIKASPMLFPCAGDHNRSIPINNKSMV